MGSCDSAGSEEDGDCPPVEMSSVFMGSGGVLSPLDAKGGGPATPPAT